MNNMKYIYIYIMTDDYMLHNALDKIKEIGDIGKSDDTKILIDADNKLPDDITLKNVLIIIICAIKEDDQFYP